MMNTLRDTTNNMELDTSISNHSNGTNDSPSEHGSGNGDKNKTPLKKEELEKIAKQLKKKLSKASITAKQQISPTNNKINKNGTSSSNPSPLKDYLSKKHFESPNKLDYLSSSSPLYSPNNKSPTHMRSSAAASLLGSSPLAVDSPTKKSKSSGTSPLKNQSTMVLQAVSTPTKSKSLGLKPSPPLSSQRSHHHRSGSIPSSQRDSASKDGSSASSGSNSQSQTNTQTTPTLPKKQLNNGAGNPLLKTPTQAKNGSGGNYNDEEGADLLMYLATSPSPAKSYFSNTPKLGSKANGGSSNNNSNQNNNINATSSDSTASAESNENSNPTSAASQHQNLAETTRHPIHRFAHSRSNSQSEQFGNTSAPISMPLSSAHKHSSSNSSSNSFIAPPPPLTPKRHINSSSKTPQNRLTPSMNLFNSMTNNNNNSTGLPSSGLALTPAGFNMNDYVNFFSPSPGGANLSRNLNNNFLKTPDFNNLLASSNPSTNQNLANGSSKQAVDGKMINFDKVGLFKNSESKD